MKLTNREKFIVKYLAKDFGLYFRECNKRIKKTLNNLDKVEKTLKEVNKIIWRTIRERDDFIFGTLSKNIEKLEKRIKKLEKKK